MKNNFLKIVIPLVIILAIAGFFIYKKISKPSLQQNIPDATQKISDAEVKALDMEISSDIIFPENTFDATGKVSNTNIYFKYPSQGFYGLGIKFLRANIEPGADTIEKQIGFRYSAPTDVTKISEYINFYIGFKLDKGNIEGEYTLENAIKSIGKIYGIIGIENGKYETFNNNKFYIYKDNDQNDMEVLHAIFICNDGAYEVSINYLKPKNTLYGNDSDTAESRAAFKNNDRLFLEILKNISFK